MKKVFILSLSLLFLFSSCDKFLSKAEIEINTSTVLVGAVTVKITITAENLSENKNYIFGYYLSKSSLTYENKYSDTLKVGYTQFITKYLDANSIYYIIPFVQDGENYVEGEEIVINTAEPALQDIEADAFMPIRGLWGMHYSIPSTGEESSSKFKSIGIILGDKPGFTVDEAILSSISENKVIAYNYSISGGLTYFPKEATIVYLKAFIENIDGYSYSQETKFELPALSDGDLIDLEPFLNDYYADIIYVRASTKAHLSNGNFWIGGKKHLFLISKDGTKLNAIEYDPISENTGRSSYSIDANDNYLAFGFSIYDGLSNTNGNLNLYSSGGTLLWSINLISKEVQINDLALNSEGTVFITGRFMNSIEICGTLLTGGVPTNFYAAFNKNGDLLFAHSISDRSVYGFGVEIDNNDQANFAFYSSDLYDDDIIRLLPAHSNIVVYNETSNSFSLLTYDMDDYDWFYMDKDDNKYFISRTPFKIIKMNANNILQWTKEYTSMRTSLLDFYVRDQQIYLSVLSNEETQINGKLFSSGSIVLNSSGEFVKVANHVSCASSVGSNGELYLYNKGSDSKYSFMHFQGVKLKVY